MKRRGRPIPLWFWRTAWGAEVDLLIERNGQFTAVECKYAEVIGEPDLKGLKAFADTYGRDRMQAVHVASRTGRAYPASGEITVIPGSRIADYLE